MEELDDIRWDWEEDGQQVRRELGRQTWQHGGWATVMFLFEERDRAEPERWKPPQVAIVRFQKTRGVWRKHAMWNLHGADEAREVAATLRGWFPDDV
jgi:hypothetical protein